MMDSKKKQILEYFKNLEFEKDSHSYIVEGKKIGCSVSQLLKKFYKPFDSKKMSELVAKSKGKTPASILNSWKQKGNKACNLGHRIHNFGEKYITDNSIKPQCNYEEAIVDFWTNLHQKNKCLITELQMYHKEYNYAGTADIILYDDENDMFSIADYKTNKDIHKNYKGKRLLDDFDFLLDTPYNKYQLQLNLYQILFEQTGFKISHRNIIWLKPDKTYKLFSIPDYTEKIKRYLKWK